MTYKNAQPPFTLKFDEMTKRDLRAYNDWFHEMLPARIDELTRAVRATVGYEGWEPDATPASLEPLGRWFALQVETRQRTKAEVETLEAGLDFPIDVPDDELTIRTFSLALDAGMYFGRVILHNVPGTRWDQPLKNKRFADYGQPVIVGSGSVPLNPVAVLVTTAYGISRGKQPRLGELFTTWKRMFTSA